MLFGFYVPFSRCHRCQSQLISSKPAKPPSTRPCRNHVREARKTGGQRRGTGQDADGLDSETLTCSFALVDLKPSRGAKSVVFLFFFSMFVLSSMCFFVTLRVGTAERGWRKDARLNMGTNGSSPAHLPQQDIWKSLWQFVQQRCIEEATSLWTWGVTSTESLKLHHSSRPPVIQTFPFWAHPGRVSLSGPTSPTTSPPASIDLDSFHLKREELSF